MEHKDFVFNSLEQNAALVWIQWVNEHESFGRRRTVHLQGLCVTGSEQQFVKNAFCKTRTCFQKKVFESRIKATKQHRRRPGEEEEEENGPNWPLNPN